MAYIYKITNKINSKAYIGKTEETVEKRFKQHCYERNKDRCKNRPLYKAMNKYGIENFVVETIEETNDAVIREVFWIEYYNTYKLGYNATKGGDGKTYVDIKFVLQVFLENRSVKLTSILTNYCQDTVRKIITDNNIKTEVMYARHLKKQVLAIDADNNIVTTFESCREASRYFIKLKNLNPKSESGYAGHIAACCSGKRKTIFGFKWKYIADSSS